MRTLTTCIPTKTITSHTNLSNGVQGPTWVTGITGTDVKGMDDEGRTVNMDVEPRKACISAYAITHHTNLSRERQQEGLSLTQPGR